MQLEARKPESAASKKDHRTASISSGASPELLLQFMLAVPMVCSIWEQQAREKRHFRQVWAGPLLLSAPSSDQNPVRQQGLSIPPIPLNPLLKQSTKYAQAVTKPTISPLCSYKNKTALVCPI